MAFGVFGLWLVMFVFQFGETYGDMPVVVFNFLIVATVVLLFTFMAIPVAALASEENRKKIERARVAITERRASHRDGYEKGDAKLNDIGVLFFGDGLSGKSQLIRNICGDYTVISGHKGRTIQGYEKIIGPTYKRNRLVLYDIRGQNVGNAADAIEKFGLSQGLINHVVIVVDLFGCPKQDGKGDAEWADEIDSERETTYDEFEQSRIDEHSDRVGSGALQLLLKPFSKSEQGKTALSSICVFINKADKWKGWTGNPRDPVVVGAFQPLFASYSQFKDEGVVLERIAGSALYGHGVSGKDSLLSIILNGNTEIGKTG